jgi:Glycosyl hydrolase family 115/Gylcosyl hydrolase family 115 C-terminal domain
MQPPRRLLQERRARADVPDGAVKRRAWFLAALLLTAATAAQALGEAAWLRFTRDTAPAVVLADAGRAAPLWLADEETPAVRRAAADLRNDLHRVSGSTPVLARQAAADIVVIGTLGTSPLIDRLAAEGRIDAGAIRGRWEAFLLQTVERPWPGVERALVIAGSDRRGTVFGIYTLSEQIGVSPWHWWADVPVRPQATLRVPTPLLRHDAPVVRYRGIFINDEAPALTGWVRQFHGGYTHSFYVRVFELMLRLRANTLWPAMWDAAFFADDPKNGELAEQWGIVIGTSHHEPMLRAHKEWHRGAPKGPWNYVSNTEKLREFWAGGLERALHGETLVTVGMRGDGDEAMDGHGNVALLERIVADQRRIIERSTGKPAAATPQVWALYKEVQDYVDHGMQVPDDVLMLFADDNWGNVRRLPTPAERARAGGSGVYYHFDYVGGPRSYKWVNTTPLPKVWEQMHLAWQHGATRLWMANVGDIKPMEVPMEFFLRYAWNPAAWPASRLPDYLPLWAAREFGPAHAAEIAELVALHTRYHGRRKPEQLSADTYSLVHHDEAERVLGAWQALARRAERLQATLPREQRDAFFQLVAYPVLAGANLQELHVTVARNRLHASQGRRSTTLLAERARLLFDRDAELVRQYHQDVTGGKWNHLMSQPHIGYTSWNAPKANVMPAVQTHTPLPGAHLGVMAEGGELGIHSGRLRLPPLEAHAGRARWFEVYNRGDTAVDFSARPSVPWLTVSMSEGPVEGELRLWVDARWAEVPPGRHNVEVVVRGSGETRVVLDVPVFKAAVVPAAGAFIETAGVVAIEAAHTSSRSAPPGRVWLEVPGHGHWLSGLTTVPVTAPALMPSDGPRLDYRVHLHTRGPLQVHAVLAPTLNFQPGPGLRYAVAFDDEPPQVVHLHTNRSEHTWARRVTEGVAVHVTTHAPLAPGLHTLRFWALDAGVVLQRLVVDAGGLQPGGMGPPESPRTPLQP